MHMQLKGVGAENGWFKTPLIWSVYRVLLPDVLLQAEPVVLVGFGNMMITVLALRCFGKTGQDLSVDSLSQNSDTNIAE